MNSPNRSTNLINHETDPVIIPDLNNSLQLERNIYRKILFYSSIYQFIVVIGSLGLTIHYGGHSKCQILFASWIVSCCIMWVINLSIQILLFRNSNPTRINHGMLLRLNNAKRMINPYNLIVVILGHILVFKNQMCYITYPVLYYISVFLLAHTYLVVAFVLILFIIMLVCLPCFLRIISPLMETKNGLSDHEINSLEINKYQKNSDDDTNNNSCIVCLEDFKNGEKITRLKCQHQFHVKCIREWLLINGTCPICRQTVEISTEMDIV